MQPTHVVRFVFMLIFVLASLSCTSESVPATSKDGGNSESDRIREVWERHDAAVRLELDPPQFEMRLVQEEFSTAVDFFERTTGIMSNTGTTLGRIPYEGLDEVLDLWNGWYERNRDLLYWDEESGEVRVRERPDDDTRTSPEPGEDVWSRVTDAHTGAG